MKASLTVKERNWILYDVGNSAFTMLVATIVPIYFNYLAESGGLSSTEYLAYWGYAASVATLIVALLGPICGTLTDTKGYKKRNFPPPRGGGKFLREKRGSLVVCVLVARVIFVPLFQIGDDDSGAAQHDRCQQKCAI